MLRTTVIDNFARRLLLCASCSVLGAVLIAAVPASAQDNPPADPAAATQTAVNPTEAAVGHLLQGLVDQGVLKRAKAQAMMNQFHADLQKAAPAAAPAAPTSTAPAEAGTVAVPYIPEIVKDQITKEVQEGVIKKAKDEHWAAPNSVPEWTSRIHLFGDVRFRDEGRFFDKPVYKTDNGQLVQVSGNAIDFIDTNAVNNGSALDINTASSGYKGLPVLNSTQNRNLLRMRVRFGISADIDDDWTAVVRLASGNDTSPVSTNQTLGSDFGKKAIWLDQAYIKYEPFQGDSLVVGRMPMPFERTELVWSENVNPDGVALTGAAHLLHGALGLRATAAAFALDTASDNANTDVASNLKVGESANRWLFAGQLGADYEANRLKLGFYVGYYNYSGVQSKLSSPCSNLDAPITGCNTDATRPTFMQKGNTLFLLRDITDPNNTGADPQYFGLAPKFEVVDLIGKLDFAATDKIHVFLTGDYARNVAFSPSQIEALPIVNNNETCSAAIPVDAMGIPTESCSQAGGHAVFKSGNQAWLVRFGVGTPVVAKRWDWNAAFTYESIQPDAVLDAFNDSDFHLGGTNAKGWTVAGNLGVAHNTWLTAKWISTDAVVGPAFAVDLFQLDLNTKF